jgi:hypothetical protein
VHGEQDQIVIRDFSNTQDHAVTARVDFSRNAPFYDRRHGAASRTT